MSDLTLLCNNCREPLNVALENGDELHLEPCEGCIDGAKDQGYNDAIVDVASAVESLER